MKYHTKAVIGWVFMTGALGVSAYANLHCSFGCRGVYSQILNPLTAAGGTLFMIGTLLILSKDRLEGV